MGSSDINDNGDFFNTDTSDNGFSSSDSFFESDTPAAAGPAENTASSVPNFFEDPGQGAYEIPNRIPQGLDYLGFTELEEVKKEAGRMKTAGILCFVSAGVTALLGLFLGYYSIFLDVAILVILGFFIMKRKSFVASVLLCVYAAFNVIVSLMQDGSIGGVIVIIAAAYSIFASWKLRKAWKEYQQTGSFTV